MSVRIERASEGQVERSPPSVCLNCGAGLDGEYCRRCGQSADTRRLSFGHVLRAFVHGVANLDSALLRTIRGLVVRPGRVGRAYVEGQRTRYTDPLRLYVLVVALNIAVGALMDEIVPGGSGGSEEGFWDRSFVALQIALAFMVPLFPLAAAARVLYLRLGYTVAEHYAFLLYLFANSVLGVMIASVFATFLFGTRLENDLDGILFLGLFTVYVLHGGRHFYRASVWEVGGKLLAMYAALFVTAGVVVLVLMAAGVGG